MIPDPETLRAVTEAIQNARDNGYDVDSMTASALADDIGDCTDLLPTDPNRYLTLLQYVQYVRNEEAKAKSNTQ